MHYHLILTENCNLRCRYCYQKSMEEFDNGLDKKFKFDFSDPENFQADLNKLKNFLSKDEDPFLIFYGGEPLLQYKKIMEIMDFLNELKIKYRMQTNGIFLNLLPKKYLNKIDKILVSIDGDEERTNFNRGEGTYKKIMDNLSLIKKNGYSGEIVARMTIAQDCPDVYEQARYLIKNGFDSVHWQLDVGFYSNDFEKEKISTFFNNYNDSVKSLIKWWIKQIGEGKVYLFYPFVGIVNPILENKKCKLRCGAGHAGYSISPSGKVVHCPIMNGIEDFKAGDLNSIPEELKKFDCEEECSFCEAYSLCGGRCMYWRKAKLWPKEGDEMICDSIKFLINEIKKNIPEIKRLIENRDVKKEDFFYEEYFGPEIIP